MERIKVAVIGTGSIGMRHLSILKKLPGIEPVAIPKRPERISILKEQGFTTAHDISEAATQGVRFGIIASETGQHVADSLCCLEFGWELLVEKPLATNAQEAQLLRGKKGIFVGCNLRFSESLNIFRKHLSEIGPVHSVRVECQSYLPDWRPGSDWRKSYSARAGEGGVLRDLIHELDYSTWIFGWPSAVQARLKNTGRLGIEAEEMAELSWEVGATSVSLALDYLSRPARRIMRAYGSEGTLEWDGIKNAVTLQRVDREPEIFNSTQERDEMYRLEVIGFLKDRSSLLATYEEGLKALLLCDAARLASQIRKTMEVSYDI